MEPCDMNTFSQLLQPLLGIGVQPKDLTFLQVSKQGGSGQPGGGGKQGGGQQGGR
jgi:hypothetical protein